MEINLYEQTTDTSLRLAVGAGLGDYFIGYLINKVVKKMRCTYPIHDLSWKAYHLSLSVLFSIYKYVEVY